MSSKQKTKEQGHDLNSMSGAFKHLWNRIPLTFKIMLWYTLFLITLLISMSIFYYNYMGTARSTEIRDRLQQQTLIMSTDIRKFKPYEDGTFYLVYTQDGLIMCPKQGNRRLQAIFYFLAIQMVQVAPSGTARHPVFREYFQKKQEEGKNKQQR